MLFCVCVRVCVVLVGLLATEFGGALCCSRGQDPEREPAAQEACRTSVERLPRPSCKLRSEHRRLTPRPPPILPQVVITPHVYPPTITHATFLGEQLWEQCNTSFGYLQASFAAPRVARDGPFPPPSLGPLGAPLASACSAGLAPKKRHLA